MDGDVGAAFGELDRDRLADPLAGAGDERGGTVESVLGAHGTCTRSRTWGVDEMVGRAAGQHARDIVAERAEDMLVPAPRETDRVGRAEHARILQQGLAGSSGSRA